MKLTRRSSGTFTPDKAKHMEELNTASDVEVIEAEGYDTLTLVDLGDGGISLSQVSEDGDFHNVIVSSEMAAQVMAFFGRTLG